MLVALLLSMMNVGQLMNPATGVGAGGPPVETFNITTEAGDPLVTESGDNIVLETAP